MGLIKDLPREERLKRNASMARARYAVNPHARRAGNLISLTKAKYGITPTDKAEILKSQGGICAICETDTPPTRTGWHIDHCHDRNFVRGILCQHCNNMLGMAHENIETLKSAIAYLEKFK